MWLLSSNLLNRILVSSFQQHISVLLQQLSGQTQ
jgi:hypothetical protein